MRELISRILAEVTMEKVSTAVNEVISNATDAAVEHEQKEIENSTEDIDSSLLDYDVLTMDVTTFERGLDLVFGVAFLITAIFAAKRMSWTHQQVGAETTVVTAFYALILVTSVFRAIWFLIPATVWTPQYTPVAY